MTLEEKVYSEVFEKAPNLHTEVTDISAVNSIFYLLSANGCYDKDHDYDWKMYSDDIGYGPISLALWSDMNANLKNHTPFAGTFSRDAKTVLHSMKCVLKNLPKNIDPRKALIGMAGYKYISQTHRLSASAIELNFNSRMPELFGMCDFCREVGESLDSKIRVLNTQRDKTL